jgi:putative transposase
VTSSWKCIAQIRPGGAPRIHGELLKLGVTVTQSTVSKHLPRNRRPPLADLVDVLPESSWGSHFHRLRGGADRHLPAALVFVVLSLERRRLLHVHVTAHPTAAWAAQQMVEALPEETRFRYLLRDRDAIYRAEFRRCAAGLGLREVLIAPRSPWQNAYAERFIGSLRRECLDHLIVLNERQVSRILSAYARSYNCARTHLALEKDAPERRRVQGSELGRVIGSCASRLRSSSGGGSSVLSSGAAF